MQTATKALEQLRELVAPKDEVAHMNLDMEDDLYSNQHRNILFDLLRDPNADDQAVLKIINLIEEKLHRLQSNNRHLRRRLHSHEVTINNMAVVLLELTEGMERGEEEVSSP